MVGFRNEYVTSYFVIVFVIKGKIKLFYTRPLGQRPSAICYRAAKTTMRFLSLLSPKHFPVFPGANPQWVQRPPLTVTKLAFRSRQSSSRKRQADGSVRIAKWNVIVSDYGAPGTDSPPAASPASTTSSTPASTRLVIYLRKSIGVHRAVTV